MISISSILEIVGSLEGFILAYENSEKPLLAALAILTTHRLMTFGVRRYQQTYATPPTLCRTGMVSLQILTKDNCCLEAVYVIKGFSHAVFECIHQEIKQIRLQRCLILTIDEPYLTESQSQFLEQVQQRANCELMIDGVIPSLKYYLRLLDHPEHFLTEYRQSLEAEFKRSSGIKKEHLEVWHEIISSLPSG
jgi:DNA (cytosine-5)-methyltransferase 1